MDFTSLDNPGVLDNFDFDSFLQSGGDDIADFDPAGDSPGKMGEKSNQPQQYPSADSATSRKRLTTPSPRASPYSSDPSLIPPSTVDQGYFAQISLKFDVSINVPQVVQFARWLHLSLRTKNKLAKSVSNGILIEIVICTKTPQLPHFVLLRFV